jgi:hypothetical protein
MADQQLTVEANGVHEFLAQLRYENNHKPTDKTATERLTSNTRRSSSCPEDLAKQSSNTQIRESEKGNKGSDKGPVRDTWEMDSGTHDLGNYEPALQQLMSAANAKGQSRSSNFLELANTVSISIKVSWVYSLEMCSCDLDVKLSRHRGFQESFSW